MDSHPSSQSPMRTDATENVYHISPGGATANGGATFDNPTFPDKFGPPPTYESSGFTTNITGDNPPEYFDLGSQLDDTDPASHNPRSSLHRNPPNYEQPPLPSGGADADDDQYDHLQFESQGNHGNKNKSDNSEMYDTLGESSSRNYNAESNKRQDDDDTYLELH